MFQYNLYLIPYLQQFEMEILKILVEILMLERSVRIHYKLHYVMI